MVQEVKTSVSSSFQYTECGRSPVQQLAARLFLYIKLEPWVDYVESISADKYILLVHIK